MVADGRDVVWDRGFGYAHLENKIPFTADTAIDGASLAKTFTAALVLALSGEGRLRLDDPVRRSLPELPYPTITWRHLLSHSSGLPVLDYDYFDKWLPANEVRTTESLLGVLGAQRPALSFAPGTAFEYSSFGYDLAALAAARVARSTYAELLTLRLFQPLGVTSAFVRPDGSATSRDPPWWTAASARSWWRTTSLTSKGSTEARTSTFPPASFTCGTPRFSKGQRCQGRP